MATRLRAPRALLLLLPLVLPALLACGSDLLPPDGTDDQFTGTIDPGQSSVVLKRLVTPDRVALELIAVGPLRIDETNELVSIDVALRNVGDTAIPAPVVIRLGHFDPEEVWPTNADWPPLCQTCDVTVDPQFPWGFLYDIQFGTSRELAPGQTSQTKEWTFHDPGLAPFSFGARAMLIQDPEAPAITGQVFVDANGNGEFDDNELPFGHGVVSWTDEDAIFLAPVGADGRYRFPVPRPGLYDLTFDPLTDGPGCTTTPNPLQVVIVPGPDGEPQSYDGADFGWSFTCGPGRPNLILTPRPLEEFRGDPYDLLGLDARGRTLVAGVGYSGCSGGHPVTLVVSTHIMESYPPQTFAILSHDGRGEMCEAYFEERRMFDLTPLLELAGMPVIVRLRDFQGVEHRVLVGREAQRPILTDRPLEEFRGDHYFLTEVAADGDLLRAHVGFSGCSGGHPFDLVIARPGSNVPPGETRAILAHDSLGEICAAFFEEDRVWDLSEFLAEQVRPFLLHVEDFQGQVQTVTFPDPKDPD